MESDSLAHIVLFSGGLASFAAAGRVLERYGKERVNLWFFDTLIEDNDSYRFLDDCEANFDLRIHRLTEGRNPWQVFRDERFIGNSRAPLCNRVIKRQFLERLLKSTYPRKDVVLHFGLEPSERNRMELVTNKWRKKGYRVDFPLSWNPSLCRGGITEAVQKAGITPPRLYALGFRHNNCGGACVKAGLRQWALLWRVLPDRYIWHEIQEQRIREYLDKDVAILRTRTDRHTRPLTLRTLRTLLELRPRWFDVSSEPYTCSVSLLCESSSCRAILQESE